jgi:hypothetical protein
MLESVLSTQACLHNQITVANSVGNANRWRGIIPYCTVHNQHIAALTQTKHGYEALISPQAKNNSKIGVG